MKKKQNSSFKSKIFAQSQQKRHHIDSNKNVLEEAYLEPCHLEPLTIFAKYSISDNTA